MATGLTESADLVVEDGTGVDDANSYNAIADVTTYTNLRQDANLTPWSIADESNQVAALIIATQYLELRWCFKGTIAFPGDSVTLPQALQWPRESVVDSRGLAVEDDEIPISLTDALSEYAARAIDPISFQARALLIDLASQDAAGRSIIETLEQVGPLREQTKYSTTKGIKRFRDYGNADRIMRQGGLITGGERLAVA